MEYSVKKPVKGYMGKTLCAVIKSIQTPYNLLLKIEKMKSNYFLIIFLLIAFSSFGQASTESTMSAGTLDTLGPCNPEAIFIVLDKKPQYKSGLSGLESEINAEYKPDINIDGVVYVQFVINCKGQVLALRFCGDLTLQQTQE